MLQALRARWYLTAAVIAAALVAAVAVKTESHSVPTGAATVQIMVDSPQSALADLKQDPLPLVTRAAVFAQLITSGAVLDQVAHGAGVPAKELTAEGPYSGAGQTLDVPTPSEARSAQLLATNAPYHLTVVPDATIPLVTVSVQGPSPAQAGKVANAVAPGVRAWLNGLQSTVPSYHRVTIRQLGDAQAGEVNSNSAMTLALIAGAGVLLIGILAITALEGRRRRQDQAPGSDDGASDPPDHGGRLSDDLSTVQRRLRVRRRDVYRERTPAATSGQFAAAVENAREQREHPRDSEELADESERFPGAA